VCQHFWNHRFGLESLSNQKTQGWEVGCIYLENEDILLKKRRLAF
jgi:hypothetical protein